MSETSMALIQTVAANTRGRDFVVGDIHGWLEPLQAELDAVCFDPAVDRLFSVGDLIDRGPDSEQCLLLTREPWFFAVRGNHEQTASTPTTGCATAAVPGWIRGRSTTSGAIRRCAGLPSSSIARCPG
jgi:serine/threonine protein phosphatase 1